MALSYKEMMFEYILNNESSSSLKTIKSKKTYQSIRKYSDRSLFKSKKKNSSIKKKSKKLLSKKKLKKK